MDNFLSLQVLVYFILFNNYTSQYIFLLIYWTISPFWTTSFVLNTVKQYLYINIWHLRNKFPARELLGERIYTFYILINSTKLLSKLLCQFIFFFKILLVSWLKTLYYPILPALLEVFPMPPPQYLCGEIGYRISPLLCIKSSSQLTVFTSLYGTEVYVLTSTTSLWVSSTQEPCLVHFFTFLSRIL